MANAIATEARKAVVEEPMMRVLERSLTDVAANDGQIDPAIARALETNGLQKRVLGLQPTLQDANTTETGGTLHHFDVQSAAYGTAANEIVTRGLVAGVSGSPHKGRG